MSILGSVTRGVQQLSALLLLVAMQLIGWVLSQLQHTASYASGVIKGLSQRRSGMHRLLKVNITLDGVPAVALIDSGASHSFVSQQWVRRHSVRTAALVGSGMNVKFADGRKQDVTQQIPSASVKLEGKFKHSFKFVVADTTEEVILGQDWLRTYNPSIDWDKEILSISRPRGQGKVVRIPSAASALARKSGVPAYVVSHMRAKRLLKKQSTEAFVMFIRALDDGDAKLNTADATGVEGGGERKPKPAVEIPLSGIPEIDALVAEFADVFQTPTGMPPDRGDGGHRINVAADARPPFKPAFRMNAEELAVLKTQITELLDKGWIRPSNSMYGAPILFVKKPDKSLRMVIDYRALNKQTVKDRYPLPRVDDLLDQLGGAAVYSKLDLASGYYQMRMHEADIHKTAFNCRYGLFEWTVLPMGLSSSPAAFSRMMDKVFRPFLDKFVVLYIDDVLVYSKTMAEHVQHLRQVLEALRANKLYAKPSKCEFAKSEIKFLGHIVGQDGIKADPEKVSSVMQWPQMCVSYAHSWGWLIISGGSLRGFHA
jgi:hypothetical protein